MSADLARVVVADDHPLFRAALIGVVRAAAPGTAVVLLTTFLPDERVGRLR